MAGETPNASKISKRRKLRWDDDRSTDKIYASGQPSALTSATGEGVGRPGRKPKPIATPVFRGDDKSTDKYYAAGGSKRSTGRTVAPPVPQPGRSALELHVASKDDVVPVVDDVIDRLSAGVTDIVVGISTGNTALMRRVRAAFDLAVTRQQITEDQYRDIKMIYFGAPGAQVAVGRAQTQKLDLTKPPVPATHVVVDAPDGLSDEDLMAMLEAGKPLPEDPFATEAQVANDSNADEDDLLVRPDDPRQPERDREVVTTTEVGALPAGFAFPAPPPVAEPHAPENAPPLPPVALRQRPIRRGRGTPAKE